jgi:hypothetical protein
MKIITNKTKTKSFECDHWSPEKIESHLAYGWTIDDGSDTSSKKSKSKAKEESFEETVDTTVLEEEASTIAEEN